MNYFNKARESTEDPMLTHNRMRVKPNLSATSNINTLHLGDFVTIGGSRLAR